ncbi:MAG: hypothetical protein QXM93_08485 [Candidatus Methanomethyliaceae archaeon]
MTDLDPGQGLEIYLRRMKIDETFRDWNQLLGLQRQMSKPQEDTQKMVALRLLVYAVGLFVGERLRDHCYGEPITTSEGVRKKGRKGDKGRLKPARKWKRYSGLFV